MKDKEKLEVLKMAKEIATDLSCIMQASADNRNEAKFNELMAKFQMIELFGQILRKHWNLEHEADDHDRLFGQTLQKYWDGEKRLASTNT